uniref:Uncharacterized protein n=1 Tax=Meloidogyne enterolobii TaxID=390850 RepID=A0A6V7WM17_MELEN|nr:unnamed protein product [Meloidogyne enterolobii]
MKHTKKMIMVPESEYLTLLSMIKGGDFLQNEKVQTDSKIKQTLSDPNLSEDVKAQKYKLLYKKRRQLKHELENRPQKVIIDEGNELKLRNCSLPKETAAPKAQLQPVQSSSEYQTDSEFTSTKLMKRRKTTPFNGIISKRYSKDLENYVKDNAEKFRIRKNGSFESNVKGRLVKNSNFTEVLEYVQGDISSPPKGFSFLFNRLSKDPLVKEMIKETQGESSTEERSGSQSGSGKRIHRVYEEAKLKYPKLKYQDVYNFLHKQRVYTMHRPIRKKFPRLVTRPSGLHTDWQADLAIFDQISKHNDNNRYLLVCIDVLSRKIFVAPVKTKRSEDMIEAFEKVFKLSNGILPHKLYTDRGLEFEAKRMKEYFISKDIVKRVVYSPDVHASMAERANRTIKERLYRYFSEKNTLRWVEAIQKIVSGINSSVNRVTGVTPNSVTFKNSQNLFERLYKGTDDPIKITSKLEPGQVVRISKEKGKFEKGYLPNYTDELFLIHTTNDARTPITYRLKDFEDNLIEGIFYREELVPTQEDTTHRIAEILKTRTTRTGIKQHFVRWVGYKDIHNSWVNDSDIVRH